MSDPVEGGRQGLRRRADLPWYDPSKDAIRRIDVSPRRDDERRHSSWEYSAKNVPTSQNTGLTKGMGFAKVLQVLAWTLLAGLLIALISLLIWAALRAEASAVNSGRQRVSEVQVDVARLENLPLPITLSEQDLLATARSYYEAGDYGQAIIYAFAHQLVELDKHRLIRLSKGKTNRQYLRELRRRPQLVPLLRSTMLAFEDVFFGHHALSRGRFQKCWDGLDEFQRQLEQPAT